jgi:pyruvate/2-oxoglutarate dehydrogenase complex dihydrolipoamide dehydrogenase (E3) component
MADSTSYDVMVIGSGQAGGPLSTAFARAGHRVVLIERASIGGTCVNAGCTPTKTMIASSRVAYLARRAGDYGVNSGEIGVDMTQVRRRKRDIVEKFQSGSQRSISDQGVEIVFGEASFVGPKAVEVRLKDGGSRCITSDLVFINTGCRPASLELEGLDSVPWFDSTSIMELDAVPEHLVVLGGGYIGLEFGQLFRRLGSAVTIIQRGERLLTREDDEISREVERIMIEDGLELILQARARTVSSVAGQVQLEVSISDGVRRVNGSHLLLAVGRTANTTGLNLAAAGVVVNEHDEIEVNDRLETSAAVVYALGDVKGGPQFTHISYDDFRIIKANILDGGSASTAGRMVPYTVYIDPQLGRVGMTETEARALGLDVRVGVMPMSRVARALEVDESRGLLKVVVNARTDQIVGFAALAIEGGELMSMAEIAMMGKLPWQALRNGIFAHPTLAESFNALFASMEAS